VSPTITIVDTQEVLVLVEVPARADMIHVLRSVAASVGARMEMPLDEVEELRIAVDEAATVLLPAGERNEHRFELALTCTDEAIEAAITIRPQDPAVQPDAIHRSWPWKVISGLSDEATIERSPEGATIRFRRSLSGHAR
jgi:serine/threonine-protein kinase RsbW